MTECVAISGIAAPGSRARQHFGWKTLAIFALPGAGFAAALFLAFQFALDPSTFDDRRSGCEVVEGEFWFRSAAAVALSLVPLTLAGLAHAWAKYSLRRSMATAAGLGGLCLAGACLAWFAFEPYGPAPTLADATGFALACTAACLACGRATRRYSPWTSS